MKSFPRLPQEVLAAFNACRPHFYAAIAFSLALNVLYLALPIYSAQVYDRVVASGNLATLAMLSIAFVIAMAALAALESVRTRLLNRAGLRLEERLAGRVMEAAVEQAVAAPGLDRLRPLRELDSLRSVVTGGVVPAVLDLPWAVLFVAVLFAVHPALGVAATACAIILVALAALNEVLTRRTLKSAARAAARTQAYADATLRNAEIVQASGMLDGLAARWRCERTRLLGAQGAAMERGSTVLAGIRFVRYAAQALVLGLGAWLAVERSITPGAMFAASILLGRAMQPVEQLVGVWRQLVAACESLQFLGALLATRPQRAAAITPTAPQGRLAVEEVVFVPAGATRPALGRVSFALMAGESLGVLGPSAAGKSTLARLLVGVQPPTSGAVRLDDAAVASWARADFGRHVGYLPQDVELFPGTVAENIARCGAVAPDEVLKAAHLAGAHEMILRLPRGFETEVGDQGALLSAGQRQQIALARAVYRAPCLVVLDEPNSNLDSAGETALVECLERLKAAGTTVVLISHRMAALHAVDRLLFLDGGAVKACGPRNELLARLSPAPLRAGARS